jgi:hypothetical protein
MSLSRCFLSSALLAGVVFSAATLPLTALGSKSVTIQLEEEPVFIGQVKEIAGPYLGLATAISLGAGVVSLATAGWRQSSRKVSLAEEQMSTLKQQLTENMALIESLKYSEARLEASGLEFFLKDEEDHRDHQSVPATGAPVHYTVVGSSGQNELALQTLPEQHQMVVEPAQALTDSQDTVTQRTKIQAATALASAQAFMGFARPTLPEETAATAQPVAEQPENSTQLDELLNHLKQVMSQIERLNVVHAAPQEHSVRSSEVAA